MRAGAQARTFFAGFGVSGSLLAAVGAAFVVAGGVLAFDQWPRELSAAPPASVEVASAAHAGSGRTAAQARPVSLPAALPTTSLRAGRRGTTVPGRSTSRTRSTVIGVPRVPAGPAATPATPPGGTAPTVVPARAPDPVADTVESTTGTAARVVRAAGAGVPGIAPVTEAVAGTAESAGKLVGGLVRGLSGKRG